MVYAMIIVLSAPALMTFAVLRQLAETRPARAEARMTPAASPNP